MRLLDLTWHFLGCLSSSSGPALPQTIKKPLLASLELLKTHIYKPGARHKQPVPAGAESGRDGQMLGAGTKGSGRVSCSVRGLEGSPRLQQPEQMERCDLTGLQMGTQTGRPRELESQQDTRLGEEEPPVLGMNFTRISG